MGGSAGCGGTDYDEDCMIDDCIKHRGSESAELGGHGEGRIFGILA